VIDWDDFAQFAKDADDRRSRIEKATITGLGAAYVGQQTIRSGVPRLLGVRLESHSTSNKNAAEILKNGGILDPARSGSNATRAINITGSSAIRLTAAAEKAQGKAYITGVRSDSIKPLLARGAKDMSPLEQVAYRQSQRLGYRAQANIDWDKVAAAPDPKKALATARATEVLKAYMMPWRGRSLYVGGSDQHFEKNFKPDFDDPLAQYSEKPIQVHGNRFAATREAIKREGLIDLMKANKGRVAAGAAILGVGGLITANLAKSAIDTIQSDGSVKGYKRRAKSGRITLVRGFKRQLAGGSN
jgi:hypothetical protein